MPLQKINTVQLYFESTGSGEPLVLVHGSWVDHTSWAAVAPMLSQGFQVTTFDRRGHSQSQTGPGPGSFAEDADDLGGLIEQLGLAPAHVVGNSGGAAIALRLAGRRPELFRSLAVHEPPLVGLLYGRPEFQPMLQGFGERIQAVVERLQAGDHRGAAQRFVDTVAFGPGAWDSLPEPTREIFARNAPTFLDELGDPDGLTIDLTSLRRFDKPALVTTGSESAPFFKPIAESVAEALPRSTVRVFEGSGHVPHLTHPDVYVDAVREFCQRAGSAPRVRTPLDSRSELGPVT
jgi:pimeloyl-ACP methyl ester carboxylesterase